jgi:two-component system sensor histidine kinase UhpB
MNFAFRDYFQQVKSFQTPIYSSAFQDQPGGFEAVVIAVPIWQDGAFNGALVGEMVVSRQSWLWGMAPLQTEPDSEIFIVDMNSTVIYHSGHDLLGINLKEEPELWRLTLKNQSTSIITQPSYSSEEQMVAFAPIPGIPWAIFITTPLSSVLGSIRPFQWLSTGLILAGIFTAVASLLVSMRSLSQPLNQLVQAARRISKGERFKTLPPAHASDLNDLTMTFNRMMETLAKQKAALQRYARQIVSSQEEERKRLSRELHDETVQDLIGLQQRIELCQLELQDDPEAAKQRLAELAGMVRETTTAVRRLSRNLRPIILEDLGLPPAVQALCDQLSSQIPHCRVDFETQGLEEPLPSEIELTLFRVVQEALNNIRKHAPDATEVDVLLVYSAEQVSAVIQDNGPGVGSPTFSELVGEGHLGLAGMAERAQLFGGRLRVDAEPGWGTKLTVEIPIQSL